MTWAAILIGLASAAWNGWNSFQAAEAEKKMALASYNATIAAAHEHLAEQRKMDAYFSYGVLGLGIIMFLMKR